MKLRPILILVICLATITLNAQSYIDWDFIAERYLPSDFTLSGQILDESTGEPMIFASVALLNKDGILISGAEANLEGKYSFHKLESGQYYIEPSFIGYQKTRSTRIYLYRDLSNINIKMKESKVFYGCGSVHYKIPLIRQDDTTSGIILSSENIRNMR